MRAEFYRPDAPDAPLATVRYLDGTVEVGADDARTRDVLARVFHASPVAVDDPALRTAGTSGPAVVQPGSLPWFQAAARTRGAAEGLTVRFVPEEEAAVGWDPAGAYRTFTDAVARRIRLGGPAQTPEPEAGETRPEGKHSPSASGTEAARQGARLSAADTSEAGSSGASGGAEPLT
jgi:hypothetical protein